MVCGIYRITCKASAKYYIGSSVQIQERWSQHRTDLRGGYHVNIHLQRAWRKYGENAFVFELLEECNADVLMEREQRYIDIFKPRFNLSSNADSPMRGQRMTSEHKIKISNALKGRVGNRKGSVMPENARKRISKSLHGNTNKRGKQASKETKRKMCESQRKRRILEAAQGGVSEETRVKLRMCAIKRWMCEKRQEKT